jgi:hypothetical protein
MSNRADPFEVADLDVSGFQPAPKHPPVRPDVIRQISEAQNFPSRAPVRLPRRRRTGRNVQLIIKATAEVVERFTALSDRQRWAFGETLEHALAALERTLAKPNGD